jgi:hypothetical protein
MTRHLAALVLVVSLLASAVHAEGGGGSVAGAPPVAPTSDTSGVIAVAPPGTVWTALPAAQFQDSASAMVGRFVETYGTVSSLLLLSRTSRFNNSGWLRDADNHELATLLFDQLSDYYLDWMRHNKCNNPACNYAYVRGQVVLDRRIAVLRVYEISFESRTGPTASVVTVAAASDTTKPLLPSQTVPLAYNKTKCPSCPTTPKAPAAADTVARNGLMGRFRAGLLALQKSSTAASSGSAGGTGTFKFGSESLTRTYYRNVRDTELSHLFDAWPWYLSSGYNMWPRVVLVIEEVPAHYAKLDYSSPSAEQQDACWRIRARIWTGPATSQDVASFNWCLSETKLEKAFDGVVLWGETPKTAFSGQTTGAQRTLGPNPPYLPLPEHFVSVGRAEAVMVGSILWDMGFSYAESDGRVWIVREQ